jgi:hypothetical protein
MKRPAFVVAVSLKTSAGPLFKHNRKSPGACKERDAPQTDVGREPKFPGLGLLGMRMGI